MLTVGLIEDQRNQLQEQFQGKSWSEAQFAIQPILQTHFLQPAAASGSKVQQGETRVGSSFKSFTSLPSNLLLASSSSWSVPLQPDRAAAASLLARFNSACDRRLLAPSANFTTLHFLQSSILFPLFLAVIMHIYQPLLYIASMFLFSL